MKQRDVKFLLRQKYGFGGILFTYHGIGDAKVPEP